ncbi:hypothetical protein SIN8267_02845 [Sinobacterium norvegicum]|uniref:Uncharacterized protein n=1 Tax=Sinobacterium norvegicum TaxID=1641715 RepID=A0ABN8EMU2_9GAMM|nr:hypothetical protein SIN8267_02845 [Sinobacterium norvegicum]
MATYVMHQAESKRLPANNTQLLHPWILRTTYYNWPVLVMTHLTEPLITTCT